MPKTVQIDKKQGKNAFISMTAFVCAIMIVGLHAYNSADLPKNSISAIVPAIFSHGLFTGAVPIFFFNSGYLFYRNIDNVKDCFKKQKKRVISVLMPFIAWSAFYFIVYAVGNYVLGISMNNSVDISITGIIGGIFFYKYAFHLWYMFQLVLFIIIAPLICKLISNKMVSTIVLVTVALLGLLKIGSIDIEVIGLERTLFHMNFFAYYFAGCFAAKNPFVIKRAQEFVEKAPLFVLALLYAAFGIVSGLIYDEYISAFNHRCFVPFVAISLWALLYKIYSLKNNIKVPEKISTMIIYGIHPIVGMVTGMAIGMLKVPSLVYYVLWFISTTLLSCLAAYIMRFIKPIFWIFSGNR